MFICVCAFVCIGIARRVANGVGIRGGRVPTPSPRATNAMHCLVLLLPCLARTGGNNVGPEGMKHLSEALMTNKSLTRLMIGGT